MANWYVIGRILGPALPSEAVRLGSATIAPATEEQIVFLRKTKRPQLKPMRIETDDDDAVAVPSVSVKPPDLVLESPWIIVFEVEADDAMGAFDRVQRDELPSVLQNLYTHVQRPYWVELVRIQGEDEGGSTPSIVMGWSPEVESTLSPEHTEVLGRRLAHLPDDEVALRASQVIHRGANLSVLAGVVPELWAGAFQAIALVIETISVAEARVVRNARTDSLDKERRTIVENLRENLAAGSLKAQGQAIDEAAKALRRLDLAYLDLQVRTAGDRLAVHPDVVEDAVNFMSLRSRAIAHAGTLEEAAISKWSQDDRAFRAAATFLTAYVDHAINER